MTALDHEVLMPDGSVQQVYSSRDDALAAARAAKQAEVEYAKQERREQILGRVLAGGDAIFSVPETPEAIWGEGDDVLWAKGESLMVAGPSGVGKTTLLQQVMFSMLGVRGHGDVLGLPVAPVDDTKVLYIAGDRPRQILRSMRRMVDFRDVERLNDRMVVWPGPLPVPVTEDQYILLDLAMAVGARYVFVDSLKDLVYNLENPEAAAKFNAARQLCITNGVDVAEIHHQRKSVGGAKADKLSDVFGGMWLTAGAGSVVIVWGQAGDEVVEFTHAKQVAQKLGPWKLEHDHSVGATKIRGKVNLLELLAASPSGLTARTAAVALSGVMQPTEADVKRAKRQLKRMVEAGECVAVPGSKGGAGGSEGTLYRLAPGVVVTPTEEHARRGMPSASLVSDVF